MTKKEFESQLEISLEQLKEDLAQIRTGRVTPAILDSVKVEAYDSKMSIQEIGSVTLLNASTLVIVPWDKSLLSNISKAIQESDIQVTPIVEGDRVRLPFPGLTEERRKEFARVVSDKVEECRQRLRRVRQDAMKDIDKMFSDKEIGEDEKFQMKEGLEEIVKDSNESVDKIGDKKIQEIMTV